MTTDTVTLTDARANLSGLVKQVAETGEPVTIVVNGIPQTVLVPPGAMTRDTAVIELLLDNPELLLSLTALHRRGLANLADLTALADARMPGGGPVLGHLPLLPEPPVTAADAVTALRVGPELLAAHPDWARAADSVADGLAEAMPELAGTGHVNGERDHRTALHTILMRVRAETPDVDPDGLLAAVRSYAAAGLTHPYQIVEALKGMPLDILAAPHGYQSVRQMMQKDPELSREGACQMVRAGVSELDHMYFVNAGVREPERIMAHLAEGVRGQLAAWGAREEIPEDQWRAVFDGVPTDWTRYPTVGARMLRTLLDEGVDRQLIGRWFKDDGYGGPPRMGDELTAALIRAGVEPNFVRQFAICDQFGGVKATPTELAERVLALHAAEITDPEWVRRTSVSLARNVHLETYHYVTLYRSGVTREEWNRLPQQIVEADDILSQLAMLRCQEQLKGFRAARADAGAALKQMYENRTTGAEKRLLAYFDVERGQGYGPGTYLTRPGYRSFLELRDFLQARPTPRARVHAETVDNLVTAIDDLEQAVGMKAAELVEAATTPGAEPVGAVVMPPDRY